MTPPDGNTDSADRQPAIGPAGIPRGVWALGLVSLFMDFGSEMVHSVLPVFVVSGLGAGAVMVGLIEGAGEAVATITKAFSGVLSDRLGKRKGLALFGYGLAALSKPLFALAAVPGQVLGARLVDRFGKGVRGAPRDALIADLTPEARRGAAYGLRQALDTVGALLGPLAAAALMGLAADGYRAVFWAAVVPSAICVAILALAVKEPPAARAREPRRPPRLAEMGRLGAPLWSFIGVVSLLSLARFSEAFMLLRGADVGLAPAAVPLVLAAMSAVYAVIVYPVGRLSDRIGRTGLAAAGFAVLIVADLLLAAADGGWMVFAGAAAWGVHLGMTQGVLSAVVADLAPEALRATAFGLFHTAVGLALLVANLTAGWLWQAFGPGFTFTAGAAFSVLGVGAFLAWAKRYGDRPLGYS